MSVRKFFGGLFIVVGGLVAILSGGCTVIFTVMNIPSFLSNSHRIGNFFELALPIGGIPFVFGFLMYKLGKYVRGSRDIEAIQKTKGMNIKPSKTDRDNEISTWSGRK